MWTYFRGWSNFSNFLWINFLGRQNLYFFYLCLNKQKKNKRSRHESFVEPEGNVNLQPKRKKVTEKKTSLPRSMNIKTIFTKILSRKETNNDIEIDSD